MIKILLIMMLYSSPLNQPEWDKLTSLKLYSYVSLKNVGTITDDEINKLPSQEVNIDEAKKILMLSYEKKSPSMWKGGGRLAIATFSDGFKRRILISTYGGFFKDVTGKVSYIFSEEDQAKWYALIEKHTP